MILGTKVHDFGHMEGERKKQKEKKADEDSLKER